MKLIKPGTKTSPSLELGFKHGLTGLFVAASLVACGSGTSTGDPSTMTPVDTTTVQPISAPDLFRQELNNPQSGQDNVVEPGVGLVDDPNNINNDTAPDANADKLEPRHESNLPNPSNILEFAYELDFLEDAIGRGTKIVDFFEDNKSQISDLCVTIAPGDECAIASKTLQINLATEESPRLVDEVLAEQLAAADITYTSKPVAEYDHQLTLVFDWFESKTVRTVLWNNNLTLLQTDENTTNKGDDPYNYSGTDTLEFIAGKQVTHTWIDNFGDYELKLSDYDERKSTQIYTFPTESNNNVATVERNTDSQQNDRGIIRTQSDVTKFTNSANGGILENKYDQTASGNSEFDENFLIHSRTEFNSEGEEILYSSCDELVHDCSNPDNWEHSTN